MPLFLSQRDTDSAERMDEPDCDSQELENTYRQFRTINFLISRWKHIYKQIIRPYGQKSDTITLLDIGFGGGDIPVKLSEWAAIDGFDLRITAIDPDPRAFNYIKKVETPDNIEFLQCEISDLDISRSFDFVISNHVLHHLGDKQLSQMLSLSKKLSKKAVIFNDGSRSDIAYSLFNVLSRPVFRSSFITKDGLTSIKRSYTFDELTDAVPGGWKVQKLFPFRLLLMYEHE